MAEVGNVDLRRKTNYLIVDNSFFFSYSFYITIQ
ncbi:hypothetical protein NC653_031113 [Populus alba x Populus x berolinensis]|uniref:Uncharacterized protein n=1 Tax=Populus alba x Populus x berolinensis TaxID=444605 RepID=A0AAD6LXJ6_9ROSI|nr:hypothetical protein NC653_031113 [Populus alba x Populus x berolinensis]